MNQPAGQQSVHPAPIPGKDLLRYMPVDKAAQTNPCGLVRWRSRAFHPNYLPALSGTQLTARSDERRTEPLSV